MDCEKIKLNQIETHPSIHVLLNFYHLPLLLQALALCSRKPLPFRPFTHLCINCIYISIFFVGLLSCHLCFERNKSNALADSFLGLSAVQACLVLTHPHTSLLMLDHPTHVRTRSTPWHHHARHHTSHTLTHAHCFNHAQACSTIGSRHALLLLRPPRLGRTNLSRGIKPLRTFVLRNACWHEVPSHPHHLKHLLTMLSGITHFKSSRGTSSHCY